MPLFVCEIILCFAGWSLPAIRGSTNAGMDWNGLQGSNSQLSFFILSQIGVSMASHTAMKMQGKIVLESMEGSCVKKLVDPGVDSAYTHMP